MKHSFLVFFFLISLSIQALIQVKITYQITGFPLENVRVKGDETIQ
ncbi:hypothetical protein [Algoriphagus sp.]